jgi:hypothetical protein
VLFLKVKVSFIAMEPSHWNRKPFSSIISREVWEHGSHGLHSGCNDKGSTWSGTKIGNLWEDGREKYDPNIGSELRCRCNDNTSPPHHLRVKEESGSSLPLLIVLMRHGGRKTF